MERKPLPKPDGKKPPRDTAVIVAIVVGAGLVFLLVIGLLALIAIPKFSDYKRIQEKAKAEAASRRSLSERRSEKPPRARASRSRRAARSGGGGVAAPAPAPPIPEEVPEPAPEPVPSVEDVPEPTLESSLPSVEEEPGGATMDQRIGGGGGGGSAACMPSRLCYGPNRGGSYGGGGGGGSGGRPVTSASGRPIYVGPDGMPISGSSGGASYGGGSASSYGGAASADSREMERYREMRRERERERMARARSERASRSRMSRKRRARTRPAPLDVMRRPIWAIKAFVARRGWISGPAAERLTGQPWGRRLAEAVEREIEARTQSAVVVSADITEPELEKMTQKGLKYVVGGRLRSAKKSSEAGRVELRAVYQLRRKMESGLKTVQVRSIRVQVSAAGIDEGSLRDLIDAAAVEIAGHVMADIPADLLAQRG